MLRRCHLWGSDSFSDLDVGTHREQRHDIRTVANADGFACAFPNIASYGRGVGSTYELRRSLLQPIRSHRTQRLAGIPGLVQRLCGRYDVELDRGVASQCDNAEPHECANLNSNFSADKPPDAGTHSRAHRATFGGSNTSPVLAAHELAHTAAYASTHPTSDRPADPCSNDTRTELRSDARPHAGTIP